ncbi:MAG: tRNA (adenosine(37)-N6)-threonylcarbamoyltransferase complex ATPase subunit type 1 TsaE [Elusimicrobia bacterium]|nr:tRNA (adenosine(37)-N6)-threonylcarbamoyltransferase complex ATPase subunit type 1 TsaE [Candidatus Obscuribacterium magneticum]MCB4755858.1 tRNA (adenosine(37)-N6)-threonylcarbamoyltransferase complex ATPase subunit type 1 TsaE [Candidatus Obscuribacterium magneticum]
MSVFKFVSHSAAETKKFGRHLAGVLELGDIVTFVAPLGAGKTTLIQGLVKAFGVKESALSPTFILAQTFQGRIPIHHLDFYRLKKSEILSAGIPDYLNGSGEIPRGLVLIEWADRCREIWPSSRLEITMKMGRAPTKRLIQVQGRGPRFRQWVEKLNKECSYAYSKSNK